MNMSPICKCGTEMVQNANTGGWFCQRCESENSLCNYCGTPINEPHDCIDVLRAKIKRMKDEMQDAIDNCRTCEGETDPERKCARCKTFAEILK